MPVKDVALGHLDHRSMLSYHYALINAMQVAPEDRTDLKGVELVPKRHQARAQLFPLLIQLDELPTDKRIALIHRAETWQATHGVPYFSALIACEDDVSILSRHLIERADVRLPDGSRDVMRFHDPRVIRHLRWIFDARQMALLLSNIQRWTWPEPDGSWQSLVHDSASPSLRQGLLRIAHEQWPQLMRLPSIRAVLGSVRKAGVPMDNEVAWAKRVDACLAEAERDFKGSHAKDRQLYAEHKLRFGDGIFQPPDMQQRLARARAGEQGYFAAFAVFDDDDLRTIAASPETARECS